jgi:Major Facilitator Superfamily
LTDHDAAAVANRAPLDWVNALLADVQGGVGPFLAVFQTSARHWEAGAAGMALTVGAGNVAAAIAAGIAGWLIAPSAVLWIVAALALAVMLPLWGLRAGDIDHVLARGADDGNHGRSNRDGLRVVLRNRPLLSFTAAITLFHFANAAMLPLFGETSRGHAQAGAPFIAACIITAQVVMVPMAVLVGRRADAWGRKRLLLVGFAALPLRGVLYTGTRPCGAGIFGALFPIVIADVTESSGRYNLAQGVSAMAWGMGAALSNGAAGLLFSHRAGGKPQRGVRTARTEPRTG